VKTTEKLNANGSPALVQQQLLQQEQWQQLLLCVSNQVAAARNRQDLAELVRDNVLDLASAQGYMISLINADEKTHYPFLYSPGKETGDSSLFAALKKKITASWRHPGKGE